MDPKHSVIKGLPCTSQTFPCMDFSSEKDHDKNQKL